MVDISNALWSEQDSSNTAANPNGWPSGSFFNAIEPTMRATMGAVKRWWDRAGATVTTSGASGTYTYTPVSTAYPTAYVQGEVFSFKADKASAGNDVININSLGAINIYKATTSGIVQIAANDIQTSAHIVGQIDTALNGGAGGFVVTGGLAAGGVATTGSPTSGKLAKFSGASSITNADLTGDITTSGGVATTLATVNSNVGSFTNASVTVNGKGLVTAASSGTISLTSINNTLGADVVMTNINQYYDGPSIAQGTSGTWHVTGSFTITDAGGSGGNQLYFKVWDGTTIFGSGGFLTNSTANGATYTIPVPPCIATTPAGNIKISVENISRGSGTTIKANLTGNGKDSQIQAVRIA